MPDENTVGLGERVAIGAGWLVAWRVMTRLLGLASVVVLAHVLEPADFGLVAMAAAFSVAINSLSEIGVQDALVRSLETGRALYDTAFTIQLLRGLATAAVIAGGAGIASDWFGEPRLFLILLLFAGLSALSGLENIGVVEFRRTLRFSMEFKLLFVPRISQFIVTVTAALIMRSYWALVIGIAVSRLSSVLMTYLVHPYRARFTLSRWRDLIGFSFWTWASNLAQLVWEQSDAFIIGRVLGPSLLGVYMLALELAVLPLSELVGPASRALFSGVSVAERRGTNTVELALSVVAALLLIVMPLTIAISAASGPIVAVLMGPRWVAAQPLVAIFVWLCLFSPFSWVCTTVLRSRGQVRQVFYAVAAAALLKAVVIYATVSLTEEMSVVAIAVVITVSIESLLFILQLRAYGDVRWRESAGSLVRIALAGAITAAAVYGTGLGWQPVAAARGAAFVQGAVTGIATLAGFFAIQFGLWFLAGQPEDSAEVRVFATAKGVLSLRQGSRYRRPVSE